MCAAIALNYATGFSSVSADDETAGKGKTKQPKSLPVFTYLSCLSAFAAIELPGKSPSCLYPVANFTKHQFFGFNAEYIALGHAVPMLQLIFKDLGYGGKDGEYEALVGYFNSKIEKKKSPLFTTPKKKKKNSSSTKEQPVFPLVDFLNRVAEAFLNNAECQQFVGAVLFYADFSLVDHFAYSTLSTQMCSNFIVTLKRTRTTLRNRTDPQCGPLMSSGSALVRKVYTALRCYWDEELLVDMAKEFVGLPPTATLGLDFARYYLSESRSSTPTPPTSPGSPARVNKSNGRPSNVKFVTDTVFYQKTSELLLKKVRELCRESGATLVIVKHPDMLANLNLRLLSPLSQKAPDTVSPAHTTGRVYTIDGSETQTEAGASTSSFHTNTDAIASTNTPPYSKASVAAAWSELEASMRDVSVKGADSPSAAASTPQKTPSSLSTTPSPSHSRALSSPHSDLKTILSIAGESDDIPKRESDASLEPTTPINNGVPGQNGCPVDAKDGAKAPAVVSSSHNSASPAPNDTKVHALEESMKGLCLSPSAAASTPSSSPSAPPISSPSPPPDSSSTHTEPATAP
jgi:hypothetical protein